MNHRESGDFEIKMEQQIDLEIEHAHLRGQLVFANSMLRSIQELLTKVIDSNTNMLADTEVTK